MNDTRTFRWMLPPTAMALLLAGPMALADVVTDWNVTAADITFAAGLGAKLAKSTFGPMMNRVI